MPTGDTLHRAAVRMCVVQQERHCAQYTCMGWCRLPSWLAGPAGIKHASRRSRRHGRLGGVSRAATDRCWCMHHLHVEFCYASAACAGVWLSSRSGGVLVASAGCAGMACAHSCSACWTPVLLIMSNVNRQWLCMVACSGVGTGLIASTCPSGPTM